MRENFVQLCLDVLVGPSNWLLTGADARDLVETIRALPEDRFRTEDLTEKNAQQFVDGFFCEDFSLLPARLVP